MAETTLSTLIKQASQDLEELQKELSTLQNQAETNLLEQRQIQNKIKTSLKEATEGNDPLLLSSNLYFCQSQEALLEDLKKQKGNLDEQKDVVNEKMRVKFSEKKQFEILKERKELETRSNILKKNQESLDDLAQQKR